MSADSPPGLPGPGFEAVPRPFRSGVENAWLRMLEAAEPDDLRVMAKAGGDRLGSLPRVWGGSNFVACACARDPRMLAELLSGGELEKAGRAGELPARIRQEVADSIDEEDLGRRLRRLRRREMVRIAWRDLAGWVEVEETMAEVSALAEGCIDASLELLHGWLAQRHGPPVGSRSGEETHMVVLGLGKLGGGELNYSSDIDLVFAYAEEGETRGPRGITSHQFFLRLGQSLIRVLDRVTADGFVFRTDMRLRPNGDSGPLALSFPAMEHYYQTHGRDWERYALIKARVVGGDREGGARLLDELRPFVYRKYLDYGAFESIRSMKEMIERELLRKGMERNIKLGRGGIREIEFLAQSYQLIRGGREPSLQTQRLYEALEALERLEILDGETVAELIEAYRFLRNTEHRLQMVDDRQTQLLPEGEDERLRLAWSMGFPGWEAFAARLDDCRGRIHGRFSHIMERPEEERSERALQPMADLWAGTLDDEHALETLRSAGFEEPEPVLQLLQQLKQGNMYHAFSSWGRDRLDRILPLALAEAGKLPEPGRAMKHFVSIVEAIGRRSAYLSLLAENPLALTQLLLLSAASPWISQWIGRHPVVLDELIRPIEDPTGIGREELSAQLRERLAQVEEDDLEAQMNLLREFHHGQELRIAAADVMGELPVERVGRALTRLAEVILEQSLVISAASLRSRYGDPVRTGGGGERPAAAGVIAYGKLGSSELGYNSDLDIVFLYESGPGGSTRGGGRETSLEHYYSRLAQRLVHILTTHTYSGTLYEIDLRLRPSGGKGTLVTSLPAFREYQLHKAWTWEHQALVRARLATGPAELAGAFEKVRREVLCRPRDDAALRGDIEKMRERMIGANCRSNDTFYDIKLDRGGLVDVEFLLQYLVLRHARERPEIIEPRETAAIVHGLMTAGFLEPAEGEVLASAYSTYLRRAFHLKLMGRPPLARQGELLEERAAVAAAWRARFG